MRIHRGLERKAQRIDADKVANRAESYVASFSLYNRYLKEVKELTDPKWFKQQVRKIDQVEREIIRLEEKIEKLELKRGILAVDLEEEIGINMGVLKDYLTPEEYRDFR
jgi:hypothetical protein